MLHVRKEPSYFWLPAQRVLTSDLLHHCQGTPTPPFSSDLCEHPCNYIYLNRGQILALAGGLYYISPVMEKLHSLCNFAEFHLQA